MGARCDPHSIAGEGSFNSNDLHHNHLNMTTDDDDDDLYSSFVIIIIPFMHYLYFKDVTSASEFPCLKVRHSTMRRDATCHQIGLGSYTTSSSSNGPRERQTISIYADHLLRVCHRRRRAGSNAIWIEFLYTITFNHLVGIPTIILLNVSSSGI